jgi:hypothetical protein
MMLHVTIAARREGQSLAARIMTPAHYLRLRRTAAGLSVAQVAERLMPRADFRHMTAAFLRVIETDGCTAKNREHIERLATVYPFDPDVYFQLTTGDEPRICSGCGCSAFDPCHGTEGVCSWTMLDACGRCTNAAARAAA